jgi:rhamnosyltransferase
MVEAASELLPNLASIEKFGINKDDYYLVIARLIPDNNIDLIIEAFKRAQSPKKLVIVGPLEKSNYVKRLLKERSDKILFTGGVYNLPLQRALRDNCFAYIHGHEKGGTNPSLVEALSRSNTVLALNVPFTREVAEDSATYFNKSVDDLTMKMKELQINSFMKPNRKGYDIYQRNYSMEIATNTFINFLEKIKKP